MTTLEIILAIVSALLGGTNIWQLFTLNSEREKASALANQEQTEADKKALALRDEQFNFIQDQLQKAMESQHEEHEKRIADANKFLEEMKTAYDKLTEAYDEIDNLRKQVLELNTTVKKLTIKLERFEKYNGEGVATAAKKTATKHNTKTETPA